MRQEPLNKPISTNNPAFTEAVIEALDAGLELVVLKRRANCGGDSVRFLVRKLDEFYNILNDSHPRDAISVFFKEALPIRGLANSDLKSRILEFLEVQQEKGDDDGVFVVCLDASDMILGSEDMYFLRSLEEINLWFGDHAGIPIAVGELSFWEDNLSKVITAYLPDADGKVRPGAY